MSCRGKDQNDQERLKRKQIKKTEKGFFFITNCNEIPNLLKSALTLLHLANALIGFEQIVWCQEKGG